MIVQVSHRVFTVWYVFLTHMAAGADKFANAERSWGTTPGRPDNAWSEATRVLPVREWSAQTNVPEYGRCLSVGKHLLL